MRNAHRPRVRWMRMGTTSRPCMFGAQVPAAVARATEVTERWAESLPTTADSTGKERDVETGLDYFGARYFSGAQGRWTSPDWSAAPEAVPYGNLSDPQTLNLYGYVRNNPLGRADADGHQAAGGMLLPDRDTVQLAVGVFKGWVNGHLQDQGSLLGRGLTALGVQPQVASNNMQAAGMDASPVVVTGIAMALPGPKGEAPAEAPGFVASPGGDVIPVPKGAAGPDPVVNPQGNTTGFAYTGGSGGPGLDPKVSGVRVMDPTPARGSSPGYSEGYVTYQNASGQGVNPQTGRTVPNSDPSRHIPLTPPKPPCTGGTCK